MSNYAIDPSPRLLRNANAAGASTASSGRGPMVINESWLVAIDTTNAWTRTLGGTGTATVATSSGVRVLPLVSDATTATVWVLTKAAITNPLGLVPTGSMGVYKSFVMEFDAQFVNVANMDNTKTAMLVTYGATGTRDDNGALGFVLASDALNALSDNGGTETITVVSPAPTLTNWNTYKIVVRSASVEFWVNNALVATHTTNNPTAALQPSFYNVSDAAASSTLRIGACRFYASEDL